MQFRIADTFTDSLAKLASEEQKAVKTAAFDLQLNPASPGMQLHKLNAARDPNFWSIRVNRDIRLIVHRTPESLMLCYVDHHDKAYQWAKQRKLEVHPKTGAAQFVEVREITIPNFIEGTPLGAPKLPLFTGISEETLLGYGVPMEWLEDVRRANEDSLLELADHLPSEAAEALLELATGGQPPTQPQPAGTNPFDHPDAQRRFRVMADAEELARALNYPWEKWTLFLHPAQRQTVTKDYNGPAWISGSAGTGKTIVALHRAVYLARHYPEARVLLTTFSEILANALQTKLMRLICNEPRLGERLEVQAIDVIGKHLYKRHFGSPRLASQTLICQLLAEAAETAKGLPFSQRFLQSEWKDIVDAWQLDTWEAYRDIRRLGRKTRLPEQQRSVLWSIFERVRERLQIQGLVTEAGLFNQLASRFEARRHPPFEFIVVDEAQDLSAPRLRFLAALGGERPNRLFFAGDLGQRIFQTPFSWKSLGVDIRGRSRTLHINYRMSHQIRKQVDRLLAPGLADVDGIIEKRLGTISIFNGPKPEIKIFESIEEEGWAISAWLGKRTKEGLLPHEIGIFVRSVEELDRARRAVQKGELPFKVLDERVETVRGHIALSTMHLAKGLEFRAVAVMACDDEIIPLQARVESVTDEADLAEVYDTERHLLYVACTRARDHLFVTGVDPASEFLDDLSSTQQ